MIRALILSLTLIIGLGVVQAGAVNPDEMLDDPVLEQRARDISAHLRCLVCQNQSIDDSDADLARDLRILVRERLTAGDTNDQAIDYVVARYGEFVLLNPVFAWHTLVLWLAAPAILLLALIVILLSRRTQTRQADEGHQLTKQEEEALAKLAAKDE